MTLAIKVFEPILCAFHLTIFGFGRDIRPGWEHGFVRQAYNLVQYVTYALPQTVLHEKILADKIIDALGIEKLLE